MDWGRTLPPSQGRVPPLPGLSICWGKWKLGRHDELRGNEGVARKTLQRNQLAASYNETTTEAQEKSAIGIVGFAFIEWMFNSLQDDRKKSLFQVKHLNFSVAPHYKELTARLKESCLYQDDHQHFDTTWTDFFANECQKYFYDFKIFWDRMHKKHWQMSSL